MDLAAIWPGVHVVRVMYIFIFQIRFQGLVLLRLPQVIFYELQTCFFIYLLRSPGGQSNILGISSSLISTCDVGK